MLSASVVANQQRVDINGEMNCTVTGNVVVSSEDGKFKQYSGFKEGIKSGDSLKLEYRFANHGAYLALLRRNPKEDVVVSTYIGFKDDNNIKHQKNGLILSDKTFGEASFLQDYIRISNVFGDFYLSRYYKNDWHGIYVRVDVLQFTSQTMTVNCRHTIDSMDNVFKIY